MRGDKIMLEAKRITRADHTGHPSMSWTIFKELLTFLKETREGVENSIRAGDFQGFITLFNKSFTHKTDGIFPWDGLLYCRDDLSNASPEVKRVREEYAGPFFQYNINSQRKYFELFTPGKRYINPERCKNIDPLLQQWLRLAVQAKSGAKFGHLKIIHHLLSLGIDVAYRYHNTNTLLHEAANHGNVLMIALLLAVGCPLYEEDAQHNQVFIKNKAGKTAVDIARDNHFDEDVINMLSVPYADLEQARFIAMQEMVKQGIVEDPFQSLVRQPNAIAIKSILRHVNEVEIFRGVGFPEEFKIIYECFDRVNRGREFYEGKSLLRVAFDDQLPKTMGAILKARKETLRDETPAARQTFEDECSELLKLAIDRAVKAPKASEEADHYIKITEVFYRNGFAVPKEDKLKRTGKTYGEHVIELGIDLVGLMQAGNRAADETTAALTLKNRAQLLQNNLLVKQLEATAARVQQLEGAQQENRQLFEAGLQMIMQLLPANGGPPPQLVAPAGERLAARALPANEEREEAQWVSRTEFNAALAERDERIRVLEAALVETDNEVGARVGMFR